MKKAFTNCCSKFQIGIAALLMVLFFSCEEPVDPSHRVYTAISAGWGRTLWSWGDNTYGQLGDGTRVAKRSPILIGSEFTAVAAGGIHAVALKKDGTVWAWGENSSGELGNGSNGSGSNNEHFRPKQVKEN